MGYQYELRHLRYFLTVAEELHFRKAAERLFISQPGLSRQVRQLEEVLGVQLFERNQRKVKLTAAGRYFQQEANLIFDRLESIEAQLKRIEIGEEGELRIGFVGSAMQNVIPDLLLKLNNTFPKIGSVLEELSVHIQLEQVLREKLDIGFVRIDKVPEELEKKLIFVDSFSVVLPETHPLEETGFHNMKQLQSENFIFFSTDYSNYYYKKILSICEDQGFTPKSTHKSIHANTIFKLVESKMGIAIVPTSLQHGFDFKVKFLRIPDIPQKAELSVIWKKDNPNPVLRSFLGML
ncbi:MAG: LysR family transcriptional regulator [Bacteroidia bacterium]|nr:LysR family transcriptional regulator [Bacteroidia bacterium]